jgi:hypothetical protein
MYPGSTGAPAGGAERNRGSERSLDSESEDCGRAKGWIVSTCLPASAVRLSRNRRPIEEDRMKVCAYIKGLKDN